MRKYIIPFIILIFCINVHAANKASQVDFLISGLVDSSGHTLTGGKVYFYTAGSYSNLKTIWTDKDKTTTAANPVTLDAYGKKPIFADGFYNIEVQNSSLATLYKIPNLFFGHYDSTTYDPQDYTDFSTVINAISSTNSTIEIRSDISIGTTTVIPSNVKLKFFKGGVLTKSASCTLTINGSIEATPDKIFSGWNRGDITFNNGYVREIYPQWWGFSESESAANNETALESAISSTLGRIIIPEGTYNCNSILVDKSITLEGTGYRSSILNFASGITSPVIINGVENVRLKNLEIQTAGVNSIGITISGSSSGYSLDNLFIQHPNSSDVGAYGVYLLANTLPLEGEIKNCTFYKSYYPIYSEGAYQNKKVIIKDNKFDTNTYGIYDIGSSTNWVIDGNRFINFSKLGIQTRANGVAITNNHFEITGNWDTFTGLANTNNPIFMGTNSARLSAYGNAFISGGTETTDRGKLFYSVNDLQGAYIFADGWDGIRTDAAQRWYGGQIFNGVSPTDKTIRIQAIGSQTADLVQYHDINGNVLSGVTCNGNPYETMKVVSSDSGVLTLDLSQATTFFCDMTENISTVTISNAKDGIPLRLLLKQGSGVYTLTQSNFPSNVKFNNNTYSAPGTNNRLDYLVFRYFGDTTGLNLWYEESRVTNLRE